MWSHSPLEMGEWLQGRNLQTSQGSHYRTAAEDYERWADIYVRSPTAQIVLKSTDDYTSFYAVESDLARLIPKAELAEAFYSMKLGFCAPGIPSQFLYVARELWERHKVANLIGPLLPVGLQYAIARQGYFGNQYTGLDACRTFLDGNINLMSLDQGIVKCGDWYEAYIPSVSMVAALPESIGSRLKSSDLQDITLRPGVGLCIGQTPLTAIGGLKGVCESVFDLRGAI